MENNTNLIPPSPQININSLNPFTRFCYSIGAIPTSYLVSMTYEEQLLWLCNYLENTVIPAFNNNVEVVKELQNNFTDLSNNVNELYNKLKSYVDNYFNNLDLQQAINNKLDEMIKNGEFEQIMTLYFPYLTPELYGAKGDGITDDTISIQNAINDAIEKKLPFHFFSKTYLISNIKIEDTIVIYGNNAILKSINNNTNENLLEIIDDGINFSVINDLIIDGNKLNNSNAINGLYIFKNSWGDTHGKLTNISIYNCSGNGIFISGTYSNSSIRELYLDKILSYSNEKSGLFSNSMTDSFIINSTFHGNGEHGIYLDHTGSIRITNCKSYFNGSNINSEIDISRIPASAFVVTLDNEPLQGKKYYTRSGTGTWQNPYSFTIFSGSSFEEGTSYYELTSNYLNHGNGIFLDSCTNTILTSCEIQDNAGDGIYVNKGSGFNFINSSCDSNGLIWDENVNILSYQSKNLVQYFYGIYLNNTTYININGFFNDYRYNDTGYIQRASCFLNLTQNSNITITTRLQLLSIEYNNISINNNNIYINGSPLSFDFDLSNITLTDENYSIVNNDWNGSYIKVKNKTVYFKLVLQNDNYLPTSNTQIATINNSLLPLLFYSQLAPVSLLYADSFDNFGFFSIDKQGNMKIKSSVENAKFINVQGCYSLN